ncbi:hypothetical protein ARMSODRAFT_961209 [Armillaria solidipes]|uniref:MYND-type domain-containing protein n=1 Tax=Armillaria solidipes TaxID=1076256 RepID=A0A2H3B3P2_9AGAR|nr:hypothetical protein ARMSODRAFT_961209 [Armillaria solidipes]
MEKLIKSAKDGSYEAMTALALQVTKSQRAYRAFFRVIEENLKFDTASIQDMKRGRLPLVPSLDPKDILNISCSSMLAMATHLRDRFIQPILADWTSSMVALMPAISFWLCLFCEHIILPSRTPEFTFIDFHHAVVFILGWTTRPNQVTMEPKFVTDYLPFLWFHPPPGCTKYDLDDARALFTAVDHVTITCDESLRELFVHRFEDHSTLTANLIVQFIVDEFSHIPEESDTMLLYQSFSAVTSCAFYFAFESLSIHAALLKNNILKWMCLVFRFVTRRVRFTYLTLPLATRCVGQGLVYIIRIIQDGHSYIYQLLGHDILLYMFKALRNLQAHPELINQVQQNEILKTSVEDHTVTIVHVFIFHFVYASILKRSKRAIFKIQQHVDGFLESQDPGLKQVCNAWSQFVYVASYRSDIFRSISDSFCGNEQCPGTSVREFMVCSGCQFTLYCSWTCQRDDWSRPSTSHRALCAEIRQIRADGGPLPMSLSDHRAYEKFNIRCLKYHKQSSEWQELLDKYNAENREPDPLWPMIWVLEYRAIGVEPDIRLESSEQFAEDLNPETLAKAREGAGTLVFCYIPDGHYTVRKVEFIGS